MELQALSCFLRRSPNSRFFSEGCFENIFSILLSTLINFCNYAKLRRRYLLKQSCYSKSIESIFPIEVSTHVLSRQNDMKQSYSENCPSYFLQAATLLKVTLLHGCF